MRYSVRSLAIAAACLAATNVAGAATVTGKGGPPVEAPGSYTFHTQLVDDRFYSAGAYEGVLNIKLSSDGTLNGTYRPIDSGMPQIVTGGVEGDNVWLDVGFNRFHVTGTFVEGRIVGYTHLTASADQYRFEAIPATKQQ